jgi:MoaA/NifB/PqqE/SkfB family radical SAM enzyme
MLAPQEVHCLAPWKSLCIKSDGAVVTDIQSRELLGNIKLQTLSEILSSNKIKELRQAHLNRTFPLACQNCHLKERSGGRSRRTFFDDVLRPLVEVKDFHIDAKPDIQLLEINASNKCNLKCRMCNGSISTGWIQEEKKLAVDKVQVDRGGRAVFHQLDTKALDKIFENREFFKNLRILALRGGEPFSEPLNYQIMQRVLDWQLADKVTLDVSTNGTVVNETLLSYFEKFKNVDLYISIEDVGSGYGYIRGGEQFTLANLEENIEKLRSSRNVTFIFTITTMIYNVSRLVEIWNWFKKIRKPGDEISFSNTVVRPAYLNYQILPSEFKAEILSRIKESDLPQGVYDTGRRVLRDIGTPAIIDGLSRDNFYNEAEVTQLRKQFKDFNDSIDNYRRTRLTAVFPELANFYETI